MRQLVHSVITAIARSWLPALLVVGASGCVAPTDTPLPPQAIQSNDRVDVQQLDSGRQLVQLRNFPMARQEDDEWCWAACAAMVHRWNGQPVSQEQIVNAIQKRAEGDAADEILAASEHEILLALVREEQRAQLESLWNDFNERFAQKLLEESNEDAEADYGMGSNSNSEDELSAAGMFFLGLLADNVSEFSSMDIENVHYDLQAGQPVVVGLSRPLPGDEFLGVATGHAYILYGLTCTYAPDDPDSEDGGYVYHSVELIDPWEGKPVIPAVDVRTLLDRVGFMASRGQAERVLELESSLLRSDLQAAQ